MALVPLDFFVKKLAVLNTFRVWTGGVTSVFMLLIGLAIWQTMERAQKIDLQALKEEKPQRTEILDRDERIIGVLGIDHIKTNAYPPLLQEAILVRISTIRNRANSSFLGKVKQEAQNTALTDDYGYMALEIARELFEQPLREQRLLGTGNLLDYLLAQRIRKENSEEVLLDLYLDRMPFGRNVFGAAAAADHYFQTPLAQLDDSQLVFLAALREWDLSSQNQQQTAYEQIKNQLAQGTLADVPPELTTRPNISAPIKQAAEQELNQLIEGRVLTQNDVDQGGITLRFTVDGRLQQIVEESVRQKADTVPTAIMMVENATGTILACASNLKQNSVEDVIMTVGGAIKPFVYATALEEKAIWTNHEMSNSLIDRRELKKLKISEDFRIAYTSPIDQSSYLPNAIFSNNTEPMYLRIAANTGRHKVDSRLKKVGITQYSPNVNGDIGNFKENLKTMTLAYSVLANEGHLKFSAPKMISSVHMGSKLLREGKVATKDIECLNEEAVWHTWSALRKENEKDPTHQLLTPNMGAVYYEAHTPSLSTAQWCLGYSSRITCGVLSTSKLQAPTTEKGAVPVELLAHQPSVEGVAKKVWKNAMHEALKSYPATLPSDPPEITMAEKSGENFNTAAKNTTIASMLIPHKIAMILLSCLTLLTAVFVAIHIHCNKLEARYLRNLR